ncbi:tRNA (guanosine(37)-N1)-methyltransferase TrmD, partial [Myxococcota bacterium]|nr:tRNA (guanosine(37)-N1)-methyltransferase TrmD [Myxococcota bacterium]
MRFDVVTLFPEFFDSPLRTGLVGKAIESGAAVVDAIDPRTFTKDRHRTVDDTPYGGGGGMVMKPGPVADAIEAAVARGGGPVLLMSPQGRPVVQRSLERWAKLPHLVLVCGRYEGFDERIRDLADEEVSLGDFVLTGGEYAALVVIDGVVRLLPGTLGNAGSAHDDSFSDGLLEHPQYTRPPVLGPRAVPDVLLKGNHADIAAWRHAESLARTRARRPDLLSERGFSAAERTVLVAAPSRLPVLELAILLDAALAPDALAVTLAGVARLALAYGVATLHVVHPAAPALAGARV